MNRQKRAGEENCHGGYDARQFRGDKLASERTCWDHAPYFDKRIC